MKRKCKIGRAFSVLYCMGRPLRYVPDGSGLVEVTCRTIQGRFLLRPSQELNEIILGVLGRAQQLYPVGICGFAFMSSHFHLLLRVENTQQLARFMGHFNSNLAREAGRLADWREKIFGRRFTAIPVSDEEAAQRERLKYVLSQGCKEGLVERLRDWPGVGAVAALLDGAPLIGYWFNRSREYAARMSGKTFDRLHFATEHRITLEPLPCGAHLPPEVYRSRVAEIVAEIEGEAAAERQRSGQPVLGARAICEEHPHHRPKFLKKSPAPFFHAATKRVRQELWEAYGLFAAAFRDAAQRLKAGERDVAFPCGSFPPALPWVGGG